jgi:hypothetical protein
LSPWYVGHTLVSAPLPVDVDVGEAAAGAELAGVRETAGVELVSVDEPPELQAAATAITVAIVTNRLRGTREVRIGHHMRSL